MPNCAYKDCLVKGATQFRFPVHNSYLTKIWIWNSGNDSLKELTNEQLGEQIICMKHFHPECIYIENQTTKLLDSAMPTCYHNSTYNPNEDRSTKVARKSSVTKTYAKTYKQNEGYLRCESGEMVPASSANEEYWKMKFQNAVYEYYCSEKKNIKYMMPKKRMEHIIETIKLCHKPEKYTPIVKTAKTHEEYMRYTKLYEVKKGDILVLKPQIKGDKPIKIEPLENYYNILKNAHWATRHGDFESMLQVLKGDKHHVPEDIVRMFKKHCEYCATGVVKDSIFERRGEVEFINMMDALDEQFKWILFYRDHSSNLVLLRPLKTITVDDVASELLKIFLEIGCPLILHAGLGRNYTAALIGKIESMWPLCKILQSSPNFMNELESTTDIKKLVKLVSIRLKNWLTANKTNKWSIGVYFVQHQMNSVWQAKTHTPFKIFVDIKSELKSLEHHLFKMKTEADLIEFDLELQKKKGLQKIAENKNINSQESSKATSLKRGKNYYIINEIFSDEELTEKSQGGLEDLIHPEYEKTHLTLNPQSGILVEQVYVKNANANITEEDTEMIDVKEEPIDNIEYDPLLDIQTRETEELIESIKYDPLLDVETRETEELIENIKYDPLLDVETRETPDPNCLKLKEEEMLDTIESIKNEENELNCLILSHVSQTIDPSKGEQGETVDSSKVEKNEIINSNINEEDKHKLLLLSLSRSSQTRKVEKNGIIKSSKNKKDKSIQSSTSKNENDNDIEPIIYEDYKPNYYVFSSSKTIESSIGEKDETNESSVNEEPTNPNIVKPIKTYTNPRKKKNQININNGKEASITESEICEVENVTNTTIRSNIEEEAPKKRIKISLKKRKKKKSGSLACAH